MASATLMAKMVGDASKLINEFDKVEKKSGSLGGAIGKLGSGLGSVAKIASGFIIADVLLQAPGLLMSMAQAAGEDAASVARLQKAVENTGTTWGRYSGDLAAVIAKAQERAFADDQSRNSLALLMAQTDDADEAMRRFGLAQDLARGAGIDLETASKLLGKVTEENVNVLGRYGISLKEGATEADLFGAVQAKFAGQADVFAKSTAGQAEQAKLQMGELQEQIGAGLLPVMARLTNFLVTDGMPALSQFVDWIGPKVRTAIDEATPRLQALGAFIRDDAVPAFRVHIIPALQEFSARAGEEFRKFQRYWDEDLRPAFENIRGGVEAVVGYVREHWPEIERIVRPVFENVRLVVETTMALIKNQIEFFVNVIQGDWSAAWENIKERVRIVWDLIKGVVENGLALAEGAIRTALPALRHVAGELVENVLQEVEKLPNKLWLLGGQLVTSLLEGIQSLGPRLTAFLIGWARDTIGGAVRAGLRAIPIIGPMLFGGGGAAGDQNLAGARAAGLLKSSTNWSLGMGGGLGGFDGGLADLLSDIRLRGALTRPTHAPIEGYELGELLRGVDAGNAAAAGQLRTVVGSGQVIINLQSIDPRGASDYLVGLLTDLERTGRVTPGVTSR